MQKTVFYSWQSDLPNNSNRSFIEKALKKAVKSLHQDDTVSVEPVVDRDVAGVGGSPDIAKTIFGKIEKADVVVADVSIINTDEKGRKVPNPNVLVELGYALKAHDAQEIILVMNTEYGSAELLPFDLKTKYTVTYNYKDGKEKALNDLVGKLKYQLKTIFENQTVPEEQSDVVTLIKEQTPARLTSVKEYMRTLSQSLETVYPGDGMLDDKTVDEEYDEKVIEAISKTQDLLPKYRSVVDQIAVFNDDDALETLFQSFKPIIEGFDKRESDRDGLHHKSRHDFYRFIGNELFVILISVLLRERKWGMINNLLRSTIIIKNYDGYKKESVDYQYFSQQVQIFFFRKQRLKSNRADLRYDLLMERRDSESETLPDSKEEYTSADLFLFLKGESKKINSTDLSYDWVPASLISFELPHFILLAKNKEYAKMLAFALGVSNVQEVQILLKNKVPSLGKRGGAFFWDNPIDDQYIDALGTI